jgi:ABC-type multidrug transport system fused ATPase/permease subunit
MSGNGRVQPAAAPAPATGSSLRETFSILGGYLRPHRTSVVFGCIFLVAAGGLGLAQPMAAKWVLEAMAKDEGLTRPIILLSGLVVVAALALGFGSFLLMRSAEEVVLAGRRNLVRHILALTMPAMRREAPGDLISRVTADTTLLRQIAVQSLTQALLGSVMLIGALVLMATIDLVLLVTILGTVLALGAVVALAMPRIRRAARRAQQQVGAMGSALERVLGAFATVKASGAEDVERERVGDAARAAYDQGVSLARWSALAGTSSGLAIQVAFLIVLGVGGARVTSGAISVSDLVAFLLYVLYLSQPVMQLVNAGTYFQAGRAAVTRIGEVTQLPTERVAPRRFARVTPGDSPASLSFEDVTFTYPGRESPALEELSLHIPATGLTAIVGPSGAGKSTLLSLIERFYDPDRGRILLDGRDLRDWELRDLRAQVAYVEQDAPVMAGTLRENLAYAAPDARDDDLHSALALTRLGPLLERLGGELDSEVLYRGVSLSGGERQRIAIARALLRQPRLLLLDEATSQLDAVNEAALREVVRELSSRTTVLVVAHRLSTVMSAARIAVLQDGRLRSVGTHRELMREDELYAEFTQGQLLVG